MNRYRKLSHALFHHKQIGLALFVAVLALAAYPAWRVWAAGGNLDTSFSGNGKYTNTNQPAANIRDIRIQIDPNNPTVEKLIVPYAFHDTGPFSNSPIFAKFRVERLHPSGQPDTTFGDNGAALISFNDLGLAPVVSSITAIELQPDGKILVAGVLYSNWNTGVVGVARLTFNGALDPTFGTGGRWFFFGLSEVSDMAVQLSDGKIVLAGRSKSSSSASWKSTVWRLHSNGTLNTSFGNTGTASLTVNPGDNEDGDGFRSVAVQADGKIVALNSPGEFAWSDPNNGYRLRRFTASGAVDSLFSVNSVAGERGLTIKGRGSDVWVIGSKEQQGQRYGAIFAHSNSGLPVATFGNAGKVISPQPSVWSDVVPVPFSFPAKYVVAGWNLPGTGNSLEVARAMITRYSATGVLDTGFGTNGSTETEGEGNTTNTQYFSVRFGLNGKIVAAGRSFNSLGDWRIAFIARYWNN